MALYTETTVELKFKIKIYKYWSGKTTFHQACTKAVMEAKRNLNKLKKKAKADIEFNEPTYTTTSISVSRYLKNKE